jgi:hypothetical protein
VAEVLKIVAICHDSQSRQSARMGLGRNTQRGHHNRRGGRENPRG